MVDRAAGSGWFDRSAVVSTYALAVYLAGLSLAGAGFFDPAATPWFSFSVVTGLVAAIGLMIGRWWVLPLAVLVAFPAARVGGEVAGVAAVGAIVGAVLLLTLTTLIHRRASARWALRLGLVLTLSAAAAVAFGGYRHIAPLDVAPAHPVAVDVGRGTAGHVRLGEPLATATSGLGPLTDSDQPSSGGSPGYATYGPLTLWYDASGHLTGIDSFDRRYQTRDGVGVGDAMAHARRVYPGLLCDHDEFGEQECAGRQGHTILFLTGNPIAEVEISRQLCYPGLASSGGGDGGTNCPQAHHLLRGTAGR